MKNLKAMYRRGTILARTNSIELILQRSSSEIAAANRDPLMCSRQFFFGIIWLMLCAVLGKSVRRRAVASAVPATRGRNYSAELAGVLGLRRH